MAGRITKGNARALLARRGEYRRGRYIVTWCLDRKNGKRHELKRFDTIQDAATFVEQLKTGSYGKRYNIYDYDWRLLQ